MISILIELKSIETFIVTCLLGTKWVLFFDSYHCWWCWHSIAGLVETCSISTEEAGGLWGPQQGADSETMSSVKTDKAIITSVSVNTHKRAQQHTGGEFKHCKIKDKNVFLRGLSWDKRIKLNLLEMQSQCAALSSRVQWGSHFLKYFTTSNQWHHSRAGWTAAAAATQRTTNCLCSWTETPSSNIQPENTREKEHVGKLHTSATD